jgi:hypothetical protein
LAFSRKCRQKRPLSWASASQFLQPCFLSSSSTPSIQIYFGRPRLRWPPGFFHNVFLGNTLSSIRTIWPAHLSLLDFITLTHLVHCKAVLILYCISSAIAIFRILDHIFCEGFSFRRYLVFLHYFCRSPSFCDVCKYWPHKCFIYKKFNYLFKKLKMLHLVSAMNDWKRMVRLEVRTAL